MRGGEIDGELYRAFFEEFSDDPIPSRSERGRFHDESTRPRSTTYLAVSQEAAWREVTYRWQADPKVYRIAKVGVKLSTVIDLTDPKTRTHYGVTEKELRSADHTPCQRLARRLRADGVEAAWTYSFADQPRGRQLVVFLDQLKPGSEVKVSKVVPIKPR